MTNNIQKPEVSEETTEAEVTKTVVLNITDEEISQLILNDTNMQDKGTYYNLNWFVGYSDSGYLFSFIKLPEGHILSDLSLEELKRETKHVHTGNTKRILCGDDVYIGFVCDDECDLPSEEFKSNDIEQCFKGKDDKASQRNLHYIFGQCLSLSYVVDELVPMEDETTIIEETEVSQ